MLVYVIIALIIGSIGSVALAGALLLLPEKRMVKVSSLLTAIAGGTLLGAAFLGMLPNAAARSTPDFSLKMTLAGIVMFFVIEKVILWRSCYNKNCERHQYASTSLILIGDAFHNFIDGIIIAAAFQTSKEFGILVTLSVLAHEIPQELADFGVLLYHGMKKKKALLLNMLSGATAIPAGIIAYFALATMQKMIPYVLSFSAAAFIYIALAGLIPQMHKKTAAKDAFIQLTLIISGIIIIYLIKKI